MGFDIALRTCRCVDCGAAIPAGGTLYLRQAGPAGDAAVCRRCAVLKDCDMGPDVRKRLLDAWTEPDPAGVAVGDQRTAVLCIAGRVATTRVDPEGETFDDVASRLLRAIVASFQAPPPPAGAGDLD